MTTIRCRAGSRKRPSIGLVRLLLGPAAICVLVAPVSAQGALPDFVRPTDLPQDLVCNPYQGLGITSGMWVEQTAEIEEPAACRAVVWVNWDTVQPDNGQDWTTTPIDWAPAHLNHALDVARARGKHVWIYFYTYQKAPQWAINKGMEVVCGLPTPWDPTYRTLLQNALTQLAQAYENDPVVDGIFMMSGGDYGEMALRSCDENGNGTDDWLDHGYTPQRFTEGCKALVDTYMASFHRLPVSLQLGSGLTWDDSVAKTVTDYAAQTYGLRIYLTFNGFGGNLTQDQWHTACTNGGTTGDYWRTIIAAHAEDTRTGYQPSVSACFAAEADYARHLDTLLKEHGDFVFLSKLGDLSQGAAWEAGLREDFARYVGAQPVLTEASVASSASAPGTVSAQLQWANRGTLPLYSMKFVGQKGVADTFHITVDLVDANDQTATRVVVTPTPTTDQWTTGLHVQVPVDLSLPAALPSGTYSVRVGLCDPNDPVELWRFVPAMNSAEDSQGRREIGKLSVANPAPTGSLPELPPCGVSVVADGGTVDSGGLGDGGLHPDGSGHLDAVGPAESGNGGDGATPVGDGANAVQDTGDSANDSGCSCRSASEPNEGLGWLAMLGWTACGLGRLKRRVVAGRGT